MARLEDMPESADHLLSLPCPEYESTPWAEGPALNARRVAIVSTAGLHVRGDKPFSIFEADYRVIGPDTSTSDLIMSHVSSNFDRTGFQQDINTIFPLDRLRELADDRAIGSVADYHYSFYLESIAAQPGRAATAKELADWFWGRTIAGETLQALKKTALQSKDQEMQLLGSLLLVPRDQGRYEKTTRMTE